MVKKGAPPLLRPRSRRLREAADPGAMRRARPRALARAGQLFIDADFRRPDPFTVKGGMRRFVAVVLLIVSVAIPNLLVDALLLFVWIYSADLITPGVLSFLCLAVVLQAAMGWFA